jgi:hypothetical protein
VAAAVDPTVTPRKNAGRANDAMWAAERRVLLRELCGPAAEPVLDFAEAVDHDAREVYGLTADVGDEIVVRPYAAD